MGPSANTAVCPENDKVGIFKNNHAHSCGRYGLRIFHQMIPRKYPCKPIEYDWSDDKKDDPWWKNPPITATFSDLTSWKNGRLGAVTERVGDIRFVNFKVADSLEGGIGFSTTNYFGDNMCGVYGGLVIGKTSNTDPKLEFVSPRGIKAARSENFTIRDVKFYNFDFNEAVALGTCFHCWHDSSTDSGARTTIVKGLVFDDATVPRRIHYTIPFRAIFYDLDGSLTGKGPGSWATSYFRHHE
jgi:hypothetical protein